MQKNMEAAQPADTASLIDNQICTVCHHRWGPETRWMCPCCPCFAVETTGPNTWAVSRDERDDDGLTTYTLLAGPGITGVIGPR